MFILRLKWLNLSTFASKHSIIGHALKINHWRRSSRRRWFRRRVFSSVVNAATSAANTVANGVTNTVSNAYAQAADKAIAYLNYMFVKETDKQTVSRLELVEFGPTQTTPVSV